MLPTGSASATVRTLRVGCGRLGARLQQLGVTRLDLASIDVEGLEQLVVDTLVDETAGISIGVLIVEVRADGRRMELLSRLLNRGFRYVGQIEARGTRTTAVFDDVYANLSHLRTSFPRSAALYS